MRNLFITFLLASLLIACGPIGESSVTLEETIIEATVTSPESVFENEQFAVSVEFNIDHPLEDLDIIWILRNCDDCQQNQAEEVKVWGPKDASFTAFEVDADKEVLVIASAVYRSTRYNWSKKLLIKNVD